MSPFIVAPCHLADAPALARVYLSAMWPNASWVLMWKGKSLDYVVSQAQRRMPWNLIKERSRTRHMKAIDAETGEVVGGARWTLPDVEGAEDIWAEMKGPSVSVDRASEAEREHQAADWESDHSLDGLDKQIDEAKEKLMKGQQYFVLDHLAVVPEYWHRGIGSVLVECGIRIADEHGFDIFIHGKKAGGGVYRKAGFQLVGEMVLDDAPYGGPGEYGAYFWVRRANN